MAEAQASIMKELAAAAYKTTLKKFGCFAKFRLSRGGSLNGFNQLFTNVNSLHHPLALI